MTRLRETIRGAVIGLVLLLTGFSIASLLLDQPALTLAAVGVMFLATALAWPGWTEVEGRRWRRRRDQLAEMLMEREDHLSSLRYPGSRRSSAPTPGTAPPPSPSLDASLGRTTPLVTTDTEQQGRFN